MIRVRQVRVIRVDGIRVRIGSGLRTIHSCWSSQGLWQRNLLQPYQMLLWILLTQARSPTLPLPQNPILSDSVPVSNIGKIIPKISDSGHIWSNVCIQDRVAAVQSSSLRQK